MANETEITKIVGQEAFEQLARLDLDIKKVLSTYAKAGAEMAKGLNFKPGSLTDLAEKSKMYEKSLADVQAAQIKYNNLIVERNKLSEETIKSIKEQIAQEKQASDIAEKESQAELKRSKAVLNTAKAKRNLKRARDEESKSMLEESKNLNDSAKAIQMEAQAELRNASAKKNSQRAAEINASVDKKAAAQKRMTAEEVDNLIASLDRENITYKEQAEILSRLKAYSRGQEGGVMAVSPETLAAIQRLDTLLKEQDAKLGIYGRNVGNYKSHWDGLGNSVAQITREFPAFAVSMNTGILALSNNIPILADQISRIRKENAALSAEGKTVVPLWKQIAGSFLSWNTVMSVGITLLTVYADDIYDWAKALYAGSNAASYAADAQEKLNNLQKEAVEGYASDIAKLELLYAASQDASASIDQRRDAVDKLRQSYPDYLGKMSEEAVLAGEASMAYDALAKSLQNAAVAKLIEEQRSEAIGKIAKAKEDEIKYQTKINDLMKAYNANTVEELRLATYAKTGSDATSVMIDKWVGKVNKAKETQAAIEESNKKAVAAYVDTFEKVEFVPKDFSKTKEWEDWEKAQSGLNAEVRSGSITQEDYDKKLNDAKITLLKAAEAAYSNADGYKAMAREVVAYNKAHGNNDEYIRKLEKRIDIERQIEDSLFNIRQDGRDKERDKIELDFNRRIEDAKRHGGKDIELAKTLEDEKRAALEEFDVDTESQRQEKELELRLSIAKKGSKEELDARIESLNIQEEAEIKGQRSKLSNDESFEQMRLLIMDKYAQLRQEATEDNAREESDVIKRQMEVKRDDLEKEESEAINALKSRYARNLISQENYEKESEAMARLYAYKKLELEIDILELSSSGLTGEDRLKAERGIAKARIALANMVHDNAVANFEDEDEKREKSLDKAINYISRASEVVNAIVNLGSTIFQASIQGVEDQIDANQDAYDKRISEIDSLAEKEIITKEEVEARKRAAEEQTAAKNKELEKKKAELQTRQAKFQKAVDMAQVAANTAAAIMAQLKTTPLPVGIPLVAMITAIGALQLATIAAQPIPKYAKGTDNHPGGLAIVGDGGKNEAVMYNGKAFITPNTPTLMSIPSGAEVIPDLNDPRLLDRFVDNTYWLTHNIKGDPVNIINNFDASGIIESNKKVEKAINMQSREMSKIARKNRFENYKNSRMN